MLLQAVNFTGYCLIRRTLPTPVLRAGQGTSHCSFQLPGALVEEKAIRKADSTIKAI